MNLELARMFIDQLAMIQEKTRGNLSSEEAAVLRNTLSNLQMAFVEVSQSGAARGRAAARDASAPTPRRRSLPHRRECTPSRAANSQPKRAAQEVHEALRA